MEQKKQTKEQMEKSKIELLGQLNGIGISSDNLDWVAEQLNQTIDEEVKRQNNAPNKNKFMKKSEQIEEIGTAISECLNKLYETKEPLSFNPFPKMYHPTDDSINIPLIVDGKKIIIEIKSSNYDY
jgi:hypothetical protein